MSIKSITTIALTLCITACSDSNEKAIGLYKYNNNLTGTEKISEVKKDGDNYLFIEDVIRNSNAIVLTKTAEGLSYRNMPLKLSSDGNTLYFSSINGVRVDSNYLSEKLTTIGNNKKSCATLQDEINANEKSMNNEQWNEYIKSLRSKTPEDCHLTGAGMRW